MSTPESLAAESYAAETYVDVLIIGAGLSGIGAAVHLKDKCPHKSFAIMEQQAQLGGTWALFKYPGIRSDSDMYTLGYNFKPWKNPKAIADGPAILNYITETMNEYGLADAIHYNAKMLSADWDGARAVWTVTFSGGREMSCNFLYMCSGYYSYESGHAPDFPGRDDFKGEIVHPQHWTGDIDYADKNVVVIGSGATSVTLIPSLAKTANKVTMLQRSPTYMGVKPSTDGFANLLKKILPDRTAYRLIRKKNIFWNRVEYNFTRKHPQTAKKKLLKMVKKALGPDYPSYDPDFMPRYNPWDQRVCLVPDGDMFDAMKAGKAEVVTDTIETFDASGIKLASGRHLPADLIVTATGLELELLGGARFTMGGVPIDFAQTYSYEGMMFSGVPNMASVFGYINASWTLRADLISEYTCRLLNHMDQTGHSIAMPVAPEGMTPRPWIDFEAGYLKRASHKLPKQGDFAPWLNLHNYARDKKLFPVKPIDDGVMQFSRPDGLAQAAE